MKEVSCRAFHDTMEALTRLGIPPEPLLHEVGLDVAYVRNPRNRVEWDSIAAFWALTGEAVKDRVPLDQLLVDPIDERDYHAAFRRTHSYIVSPRQLYRVMFMMLRSWFPNVEFLWEDLGDDQVRATFRIPDDARDCPEWFHLILGLIRTTPRIIGLNDAYVEMVVVPRQAAYTVTMPPNTNHVSSLWRRLTGLQVRKVLSNEITAQRDELAESYRELRATLVRLEESERRARELFEAAFVGMLVHENGTILDINAPAAELLGYRPDELVGRYLFELVNAESKLRGLGMVESNKSGASEVVAIRKDGSTIDLEVVGKGHVHEGRQVRIVAIRDITERKALEAEVAKAQQLETVGVLAAGIAHDFNNLLAINLSNLDLASRYAEGDDRVRERLDKARSATLRAKGLTERLLTFSRGGSPMARLTALDDLLRDCVSLALSGSNVSWEDSIAPDLWAALVDPGQIQQVVSNVVINAKEAMAEGGRIVVLAENRRLDEEGAQDVVHICISDDGPGITAEDASRVFEPFFTTKPEGTGLGLAIARSVVEKHGGRIVIDPPAQGGCAFHVYLPACVGGEAGREPDAAEASQWVGHGRVLIVDDESGIREALGAELRLLGLEPTYAATQEQALEVCEEAQASGRGFDAAILDLTIPGSPGGDEIVAGLKRIQPDLKVIASSGYSTSPAAVDHRLHGFVGFLLKPYELGELTRVLRAALGDAPVDDGETAA